MSAPVSQISAAALPAGTKQLALVAARGQRVDHTGASRFGVTAVLLERESEMLPDELGTRDATLTRSEREQSVVLWIERDRRRLLPCKCHGSNMT